MNHILLIEDDAAIAQSIVCALKREQFAVNWVSLGEDALTFIKDTTLHLVILDVELPDKTGFDVYKKIHQPHSELPIIFLTAQTDEIDRVVGFELDADNYVSKPFSPRELILRIKAVLRCQYNSINTQPNNSSITLMFQ